MMQTRENEMSRMEIVKEQADEFKELIDEDTAKVNTAIRVAAHQLQSKKRKADDLQRQTSRLEE